MDTGRVVKKLLLLIVFSAATVFAGPAQGAATPAPYAGACGLPAAQPLWMDFGSIPYETVFGRPGVIIGASSGDWPAKMRAAGASTVYFDLNLKNRVGTTIAPHDPALLPDRAKKFFDYAVQQTGCPSPVIALNELAGAGLVTPWSDKNAQYRQNVLTFVQLLTQLGAHPVLLVPVTPYAGGDALAWWQQVSASAEIVREVYVPASRTWQDGPVLGNRTLRNLYRQGIDDFTAMGIVPSRLGIMISFASTKGFGGRSGLQPASAWFQVAKWQALAVRQVAAETGIASVWSWGWGTWNPAEQDPDKTFAACAWLWARSPSLCDAPGQITGFDTSLTEGQLSVLTPGRQCVIGKAVLSNDAIQKLQLLTGERDTAYSALYQRLIESESAPVSSRQVLAAERAVIAQAFKGSRAAYVAGLRKVHASVTIARGILGDQLRRAQVAATLSARAPSASDVQVFYDSYPELLVRQVKASPAPTWLDRKPQGLALSEVAPNWLFDIKTGRGGRVRTSEGVFTVKALNDALPLGAVPLGQATPAIKAALRSFARGAEYERWSVGRQRFGLNSAICARDDMPQPAAVDLTAYAPFLRLG
jgi:hypothetical protein